MKTVFGTNVLPLLVLAIVVIKVSWCQKITNDDIPYNSKQFDRHLINWINAMQYGQQNNNICRYVIDSLLQHPVMPKRNSELINSLLGLPKSMNDAGK